MKDKITAILRKEFQPSELSVIDDSARHAGHAETMASGGGHYQILIVSAAFDGAGLTERHRMIYRALKPLSSGIHALGIRAYTPREHNLRA